MEYEKYIRRCIELARLGEYYVAPNPMVGAVLVRNCDERILGEGWHQWYGGPHAEVNCLANAEVADYSDCTLFVSLEPCSHYGKTPPCVNLILEKKIGHVVVGMQDPNPKVSGRGIRLLREAGVDVTVGVLESECRDLNKRFLMLHEHHRPYVILKWAQTADGFVDHIRNVGKERNPLIISTELTKRLVHRMRAENMVILVGSRTVILDNPKLLCSRWKGRNPVRVVLDRSHRIPADSLVFSGEAETLVYHDNTEWSYILHDLAEKNIHSVLVEGGPTVLEHILQSRLWDEIHVEAAPIRIGNGVPAPHIPLPAESRSADGNILYTLINPVKQ